MGAQHAHSVHAAAHASAVSLEAQHCHSVDHCSDAAFSRRDNRRRLASTVLLPHLLHPQVVLGLVEDPLVLHNPQVLLVPLVLVQRERHWVLLLVQRLVHRH